MPATFVPDSVPVAGACPVCGYPPTFTRDGVRVYHTQYGHALADLCASEDRNVLAEIMHVVGASRRAQLGDDADYAAGDPHGW